MAAPESVRVFAQWCVGPRAGVAELRGLPHLFLSDLADLQEDDQEEAALLFPIEVRELDELISRLDAAGGTWSSLSGRTFRGREGTLYAPMGTGDRPFRLNAWNAFQATWQAFQDQVIGESSGCLLARGSDFGTRGTVARQHVSQPDDSNEEFEDCPPLEAVWRVIAERVGRDSIDLVLYRWKQFSLNPSETDRLDDDGWELPF